MMLPSVRVEVINAAPAAQALKDEGDLVRYIRWGQHRDVLPHRLLGEVAKQSLGSRVPIRDRSVELFADDSIVAVPDESDEPLQHDLVGCASDLKHGQSSLQGCSGGSSEDLSAGRLCVFPTYEFPYTDARA